MSDFDLEHKFPDLKPIRTSPSLFTINGFGLSVYGARDHDEETNTYVKTHCVCALFIPVLALGAYRVSEAEEGWHFRLIGTTSVVHDKVPDWYMAFPIEALMSQVITKINSRGSVTGI